MRSCYLACVAALALTGEAVADFIDQNQPEANIRMALFSQPDLAQSFQQTSDNISGAGIHLHPDYGTAGDVTIELWDELPNVPGANMLATATGLGLAGEWVDVFWAPVPATPGETYYLVFSGDETLAIWGSTENPYPYGNVFANDGFQPYWVYDYTFRTYAVIPAPGAIAVIGLALGGVWRRRR